MISFWKKNLISFWLSDAFEILILFLTTRIINRSNVCKIECFYFQITQMLTMLKKCVFLTVWMHACRNISRFTVFCHVISSNLKSVVKLGTGAHASCTQSTNTNDLGEMWMRLVAYLLGILGLKCDLAGCRFLASWDKNGFLVVCPMQSKEIVECRSAGTKLSWMLFFLGGVR